MLPNQPARESNENGFDGPFCADVRSSSRGSREQAGWVVSCRLTVVRDRALHRYGKLSFLPFFSADHAGHGYLVYFKFIHIAKILILFVIRIQISMSRVHNQHGGKEIQQPNLAFCTFPI